MRPEVSMTIRACHYFNEAGPWLLSPVSTLTISW